MTDDDHVAHAGAGEVCDDLMRLRKGRGLAGPGLARKIGPALATVLGVDVTTPEAELRRQVQGGIVEAAQALTEDLREAVLVSLGVGGWSVEPLLTDRIRRVATAMDRDARTARRRLDAATLQLADSLVARGLADSAGNAFAPAGWYVESLASTLRFALPAARLTEDRVIVADTDGLDTVTATLSVPPRDTLSAPELAVTTEAGCEIRSALRVSESHWLYELALPHPLRAGERHRYVISFSVPDGASIRPHYALIPLRRTRRFSAELRFADPRAVSLAWRLDGVPQSVLDDATPARTLLRLDEAGIVRVRFEHIVQGLCYGVQWRWA
jgi:hypothetical protein